MNAWRFGSRPTTVPCSKNRELRGSIPSAFMKEGIFLKYQHLLAPLKIGNVTLKNRLLNSKCVSSDAMEPELAGPFYEHLARNGAATVTMGVGAYPDCEGKVQQDGPLSYG